MGEKRAMQPSDAGGGGESRKAVRPVVMTRIGPDGRVEWRRDAVAGESPLQIDLGYDGPLGSTPAAGNGRTVASIAVTMRTPGDDAALAVGFLVGEGIVRRRADVAAVVTHHEAETNSGRECDFDYEHRVRVELAPGVRFDEGTLQRNFYVASSCGVCGKASLDAVRVVGCPYLPLHRPRLTPSAIMALPDALCRLQPAFAESGGLHAAAVFAEDGRILGVAEDVGRHNAVDKIVGRRFLAHGWPIADGGLIVSGRASFEIVQKAVMAGLPVVVAIGAPSTLALDLARDTGITLIGFTRADRFNIYTHPSRIIPPSEKNRIRSI